jgi:butyrate kinase
MHDIRKMLVGKGGMAAYLGTNDVREVEQRAFAGDDKAKLILDAFIYQVAKEIGKYSVVLCGEVDAIILTGGVAYSKYITDSLIKMISFIGPVYLYPGEDELLALAQGGLRVLKGEEKAKEYK